MQRINPARRSRPARAPWIILACLLGLCAFAFRQGLFRVLNPLPIVDLAEPNPWFIDWRLAALRYDPELCRRVLVAPYIEARPIADHPLHDGCGWSNAVRMIAAGGVRASFDKITCEAAAALTLWLTHDLQQVAVEILGRRVAGVRSFGTYSCRNILGNPLLKDRRSEHARANAVDIGGFTLTDGRSISVRSYSHGDNPEARFLKAAHARACRYFRVVLGPQYNDAHHDHFHLDRGSWTLCQ